ncbi:MAG: hypothetical protein ACRDK7_03765 [Solirubrobacteraceae bacterium]
MGSTDETTGLVPAPLVRGSLMSMIVLPYLGPRAAHDELGRPAEESR